MRKPTRKSRDPLKPIRTLERGRYASMFKDKSWTVTLDADLVDLLSGSGTPLAHLVGFADRSRTAKPRTVQTLLLTDKEMRDLSPILVRLGALVRPIHSASVSPRSASRARKAS